MEDIFIIVFIVFCTFSFAFYHNKHINCFISPSQKNILLGNMSVWNPNNSKNSFANEYIAKRKIYLSGAFFIL